MANAAPAVSDHRVPDRGADREAVLRLVAQLQEDFIADDEHAAIFQRMVEAVITLTQSAFGFFGEALVDPDGRPYLRLIALTDISWNAWSRAMYRQVETGGLEFRNFDNIIGRALSQSAPTIVNDMASNPHTGELPPGHPPITTFLALPVHKGDTLVGMIGLANRPGGYSPAVIELIEPIVQTCGTLISAVRIERERRAAVELLHEAVEAIPEGIVVHDVHDRMVLCNSAYLDLYPKSRDGRSLSLCFEDLVRQSAELGEYVDSGETEAEKAAWIDWRLAAHRNPSGPLFQTTRTGRHLRIDERRTASGLTVGLRTDLTEILKTQTLLRGSEAKFRSLFDLAPLGIARFDADDRIVEANPALCTLLGRDAALDGAFALVEILHEDDRARFQQTLKTVRDRGRSLSGEFRIVVEDGAVVTVLLHAAAVPEQGGGAGVWALLQDISERKRIEDVIWHAAHHDSLTGLPNRTYLAEYLAGKAPGSDGPGASFGLLLVDLDNFKLVNDTLGHEAGDVLLTKVADRLAKGVRKRDFVARLGGDEFAVVASNARSVAELQKLADRLLVALTRRIPYGDRSIQTYGSIGIALFPPHGRDARELIRSADIALYEAKRGGRNRAVVFDGEMLREARARFDAAQTVRQALAENRIVPVYQPIVDLTTGRLDGLEALFRVKSETDELIGPAELASIFEHHELGRAIDLHMLDLVTADMADWLARGIDVGQVAVNVCDGELGRHRYDERVLKLMASRGIPEGRLRIEVAEAALLRTEIAAIAPTFAKLAAHRVDVALDDFGTAFAALKHLKSLPIQQVKIDRSFIADIDDDPASRSIVAALVRLCADLGKKLIAEGVETERQRDVLLELGCRYAQGYLIARPMTKAKAEIFVLRSFAQAMRREIGASDVTEVADVLLPAVRAS